MSVAKSTIALHCDESQRLLTSFYNDRPNYSESEPTLISERTAFILYEAYVDYFGEKCHPDDFFYRSSMEIHKLKDFLYDHNFPSAIIANLTSEDYYRDDLEPFMVGLLNKKYSGRLMQDIPSDDSHKLLKQFAEALLVYASNNNAGVMPTKLSRLETALEGDGYSFQNNRLGTDEDFIQMPDYEMNIIERRIGESGVGRGPEILRFIAEGQASENRDDYVAAMGKYRLAQENCVIAVFESVFEKSFNEAYEGRRNKTWNTSPVNFSREELVRVGFWGYREKALFFELYSFLSHFGTHAGGATSEQARLTQQMTLAQINYILRLKIHRDSKGWKPCRL